MLPPPLIPALLNSRWMRSVACWSAASSRKRSTSASLDTSARCAVTRRPCGSPAASHSRRVSAMPARGDVAHGNVTALGHQQAHQLASHSRSAAGDDGDPAGEFFHRSPLYASKSVGRATSLATRWALLLSVRRRSAPEHCPQDADEEQCRDRPMEPDPVQPGEDIDQDQKARNGEGQCNRARQVRQPVRGEARPRGWRRPPPPPSPATASARGGGLSSAGKLVARRPPIATR